MQSNPYYPLLVQSVSSFPSHQSAAYLLHFYHTALFSHGIAPLRAVSATRLTSDASVQAVCCITT